MIQVVDLMMITLIMILDVVIDYGRCTADHQKGKMYLMIFLRRMIQQQQREH